MAAETVKMLAGDSCGQGYFECLTCGHKFNFAASVRLEGDIHVHDYRAVECPECKWIDAIADRVVAKLRALS